MFFTKVEKEYGNLFKKTYNDEFFGVSPPSVFIGSKLRYPKVNVGILSPPERVEDAWLYDKEEYWSEKNFTVKDVLKLRGNLINSRFRSNVYDTGKFLDIAKEIAMSSKDIDVEIKLDKKIKMGLDFDKISNVMGPRGSLRKVKVVDNIKIKRSVEKVVEDKDLKAVDALKYLYKRGFEDSVMNKLLSVGVLGVKKNRKLVPTRWSISCVHDVIGKNLIKDIKNYGQVNDFRVYFGGYLGNYFLVLVLPDVFNYELFEMYLPGCAWNTEKEIKIATDYEDFYGRKKYADKCGGGYYATRLGCVETLNRIKKQGNILVFRFETPEYNVSLGVWVVLAGVRKTLKNNPLVFENRDNMLNYVKDFVLKRFNFDLNCLLKRSKIINNIRTQLKLSQFFR
ncbi:hypothetical protein CL618_02310 [archaeon]|nr:hypothetical protein [archaeon]